MFRELFNTPVIVRRASPAGSTRPNVAAAPAPEGGSQDVVEREGAFITVQSLASFPGAVAAVTLIVKILTFANPHWAGNRWLYIIAAIIVGAAIYFINEDPKAPAKPRQQQLIGLGIAFLNTCVILSAAVGAETMTKSSVGPTGQTPNPVSNVVSNVGGNHD